MRWPRNAPTVEDCVAMTIALAVLAVACFLLTMAAIRAGLI